MASNENETIVNVFSKKEIEALKKDPNICNHGRRNFLKWSALVSSQAVIGGGILNLLSSKAVIQHIICFDIIHATSPTRIVVGVKINIILTPSHSVLIHWSMNNYHWLKSLRTTKHSCYIGSSNSYP